MASKYGKCRLHSVRITRKIAFRGILWTLVTWMSFERISRCVDSLLLSNFSVSWLLVEYILIRSNEMQQCAGVYLLQNYSTCFGCLSHPSSGVHQNVTAASFTGHSVRATIFRQRSLIRPRWQKVVTLTRDVTCKRNCSYSLMYSWWWVR